MQIQSDTFTNASPEKVLKEAFGYDEFRHSQKDIIENVLAGHDTLAVMPTGGGKSLCYQIPALIFEGITIVISPLISLMQDQVSSLEKKGINSVFINSTLEWEDFLEVSWRIRRGEVKIVYISPEGLSSNKIKDLLTNYHVLVSCVTIDEAHCISEWGHDFRPDYLEIFQIRRMCPEAVMLALTATATEAVRNDIIRNLGMNRPKVFISSFNRPNIFLNVKPKIAALDLVCDCLERHKGESGIIYCLSRRQVDELTVSLKHLKYSVKPYHAGLSDEVRAKNQESFIIGKTDIIVATVAFGMGIDKPDVRFVINYDLPKSIEEYYQEIGRAGRDGLPSEALLLFTRGDAKKIQFFFKDLEDKGKAETLLNAMVNYGAMHMCRRKSLLGYFGEIYDSEKHPEQTKCCDICSRGKTPLYDATVPVQKFLCCMIRTNERFGTQYIIDVLLGSRQKRIVENKHNKVSTWGIGKDISKEKWFELADLMLMAGYIKKEGEYNILKMTPAGRNLLVTRENVYLPIGLE
ncbi:MAG: ATP-dependent DNA helicase [Treponema sp.]|nr:ATP-dependent DNA helicase [Treponema sp.]